MGKPPLLCEEDIRDRETNDFQGIGETLQLGAWMLLHFARAQDQVLFQQAKNANFDTACGFDLEDLHPRRYPRTVEEMDLIDCLYTALDLKEQAYASRLIDLWVAEQAEWNKDTLSQLANLELERGNLSGRAQALAKREQLPQVQDKAWDHSSALSSLTETYLRAGMLDQAVESAARLRARIVEVPNWDRVGLGRFTLEHMVDIALEAKAEQAREAWNWSAPVLRSRWFAHVFYLWG